MKKIIFTLFLSFVVVSISAQEAFIVPELSLTEKLEFMVGETDGFVLSSISYAKSEGKSVEDVASYTGKLFAELWDKDGGFNALVNGVLHNIVCINGKAVILEQSETMVKISTSAFYPYLQKRGSLFNVTYDEYVKFHTRVKFSHGLKA